MNCPHCGHEMTPSEVAKLMAQLRSEESRRASRENGAMPVKPGSKPRGRPRKSE